MRGGVSEPKVLQPRAAFRFRPEELQAKLSFFYVILDKSIQLEYIAYPHVRGAAGSEIGIS